MRRPFPIAEVVVVLLVVFLVVRFVLPLFARVRDGRRGPCLSNLKQLGLAAKQYAQDFDDRYPWHVGVENRWDAWRDLGILFPNYCTGFGNFICPSSRDRKLRAPTTSGANPDKGPLDPFAADLTISYGYCMDARESPARAWTEDAPATTRIAADKKAGTRVGSPSNPAKLANHGDDGRNVLYQDGHVTWKAGGDALDPDEDSGAIGAPGAHDYRRWWSDPPYSGEASEERE